MASPSTIQKEALKAVSAHLAAGVTIQSANRNQLAESMRELAPTLTSYVGTIDYVAMDANGLTYVQLSDPPDAYGSVWPQWAYDLAKAALLSGRSVLVLSNGLPFGTNLAFVYILSPGF
jgi:hypothetical protein